MSFVNTSTVRYCLRRTDGADQALQVRLGYFNRLISRSPFAGLPYETLQETPSSTMGDIDCQFPLPLRELEDPLFCHSYVLQLLSSFDLGSVNCEAIARKIASFVVHLAAENFDVKFRLVVDIDSIQMFWNEKRMKKKMKRSSNMDDRCGVVMVEERVVLEKALPLAAIEIGQEELGECSVCFEELEKGKELAIIPCGHYYHKSCILAWLQRTNSCPLCRTKLQT